MRRLTRWLLLLAMLISVCAIPAAPAPWGVESVAEARGGAVHVRGYYRKSGTYVQPHYRSAPDGNFYNNWSTRGNVNPYTGQPGTKVSPPATQGQDVYVESYVRSDGTYVPGHYRSAPDGDQSNNWSSVGNVNPYSGEPGRRAVAWLQQSLVEVGEDPGLVDGVLGRKTAEAFQSFATKQGTQDQSVAVTILKLRAYLRDMAERGETADESVEVSAPSTVGSEGVPVFNRPSFTVGSSPVDVIDALGRPDAVRNAVWFYGNSSVTFEGGRVSRWSIVDRPLPGARP